MKIDKDDWEDFASSALGLETTGAGYWYDPLDPDGYMEAVETAEEYCLNQGFDEQEVREWMEDSGEVCKSSLLGKAMGFDKDLDNLDKITIKKGD